MPPSICRQCDRRRRRVERADRQQPHVGLPLGLRRQNLERRRLETRARRSPRRTARLGQHFGRRRIDGAIEPQHAAERAQRVAVQRLLRRLGQRRRRRRAARIVVLDDRRRRLGETRARSASALSRSSRLLYDSSLPSSCCAATTLAPRAAGCGIDRAVLMRVLAVPQLASSLQRHVHASAERARGSHVLAEPVGDRRVVRGRVREGRGRQLSPQLERRAAVLASSARIVGVLPRLGGDRREGVILGRGPHEARPADVDVLDRLRRRHAAPGDRLLERIEIHDHQLEQLDAVLAGRRPCRPPDRAGRGCRRKSWDAASSRGRPSSRESRCTRRRRAPGKPLSVQELSRAAGAVDLDARRRPARGPTRPGPLLSLTLMIARRIGMRSMRVPPSCKSRSQSPGLRLRFTAGQWTARTCRR